MQVPSGSLVEYKYVVVRGRRVVRWEAEENRTLLAVGASLAVQESVFGQAGQPLDIAGEPYVRVDNGWIGDEFEVLLSCL